MAGDVFEQVCAVTKLKPKPRESELHFSDRVANVLKDKEKVPEDLWNTLSDEAQNWFNDFMKADEAKTPDADMPTLPGFEPNEAEEKEDEVEQTVVSGTEKTKPARKAAPKVAKKKVAKPAAKTKTKTKTKTKAGTGPGRKGQFALTDKITVLAKENPRRKGTAKYTMFQKYKTGMTVEEALRKGITRGNMTTDRDRGNIKID